MAGTIIITGANGSLAIPAVQHLLTNYSKNTLVLTVRNTLDEDVNTKKLREVLSRFPDAKTSIRGLDLANLQAVTGFAKSITSEIAGQRLPPLASIVCNAYCWDLVGGLATTVDGYEKTFQVNHLAHAALVLRLLGSFGPSGGRVVLFSSDAHWKGKNQLEKYPPVIPDDLNLLVKPAADDPPDNLGHGFQRYAVSKLAIVTWAYALNRHLEKDSKLSNITAVAINPGNLADSRALRVNTPRKLVLMSKYMVQPLRVLLHLMDHTMRTSASAGVDVAELATNKAHPGERGYFTLLEKDASSPDSMNEETQQKLWVQSLTWAGITPNDVALTNAFE